MNEVCREEEKLNLKWRDFSENVASSIRALRDEHEFGDVTLVCEDGQQVEAHKAILASSSPFFLDLLKENPIPHPLVFMMDLKFETVLAIVDFLYHGETTVDEEEVKLFLAAAKELKVKGLANLDAQFKSQTNSNEKKHKIADDFDELMFDFAMKPNVNPEKDIRKPTPMKKIKKHLEEEILTQIKNDKDENVLQCPECPIQVKHMTKHIKQVHTRDRKFLCTQCNKGFMYGDKLKSHIRSVHDKEKPYECRYGCGVRVSESGNRRKHEKQKHGQVWEGVEGVGGGNYLI